LGQQSSFRGYAVCSCFGGPERHPHFIGHLDDARGIKGNWTAAQQTGADYGSSGAAHCCCCVCVIELLLLLLLLLLLVVVLLSGLPGPCAADAALHGQGDASAEQ